MVFQKSILLEKLQSIHDRALASASRKLLYLAISEYMDVFDKDLSLKPISKSIISLQKEAYQRMTELEQSAIVEMQATFQQIRDYIDNKGITDPAILDNLNKYKAFENNSIQSSDGPIRGRHSFLTYALMKLVESDNGIHKTFANKYGNLSSDGQMLGWNFSPSFELWNEEVAVMRRIEESKIWFSWNQLVIFYMIFNQKEKIQDQYLKEGRVLDFWGTSEMFREIEDILAGRKPRAGHHEYDDETYKMHLQRVHMYVKEYCNIRQENESINSNQYSLKDNILTINGREIKFQKDKRPLQLLRLLASRRSASYYSELVEEMEGAVNNMKDSKNSYYETCRGISYSLAKAGITDFLNYDYNQVKINPLYKKCKS